MATIYYYSKSSFKACLSATLCCYVAGWMCHHFGADFFSKRILFWLINLGVFFHLSIAYSLPFLTILLYHVHFPQQVIDSPRPANVFYAYNELPHALLEKSLKFLLYVSPLHAYILLYSSLPMLYLSFAVLVWIRIVDDYLEYPIYILGNLLMILINKLFW